MTIDEMQKRVTKWAWSKGWMEREVSIPEQVALIHSEASEALESWRRAEPLSFTRDRKPEGLASEYADIVIRVMHYASMLGFSLESALIDKMNYNDTREHRHGGKLA